MNDVAWTAIAALGASALTGLASLGVVAFQERRRRIAADRVALHAAIIEMLSRSMAVTLRGMAVGAMMKKRSGLGEALDITLHHSKPLDALEFHDWLAKDWAPLNAALSEIWTRWDQEGVRLANDVAGKAADLLGVSTALQPARSGWERARIWAAGERWTSQMLADNERATEELADSRKRFADYARRRLKLPAIDLFTQVDPEPVQDSSSSANDIATADSEAPRQP